MKSSRLTATTLKTVFSHVCFASFIAMASFTSAHAQKLNNTTTAAATVSYIGYANDQYSFLMKYDNDTAEKFIVTITDSDGNTLYKDSFADKKFSKIFRSPLETGSLTFVISNPGKKEEKKFKVNAERHMAEEFSITKAN